MNPYGPSPAAFDAMRRAFDLVWRYPDEAADELAADLARFLGLGSEQVLVGNGSSEILKLCAAAFTGSGRLVVMADPTFEAARFAGLVYVCNPNNPTGTVTPDLRGLVARLPANAAVLVDEAYHQANFLMIAFRRDVGPLIDALSQRKVYVGCRFAALPSHLRVTAGTRPHSDVFPIQDHALSHGLVGRADPLDRIRRLRSRSLRPPPCSDRPAR